MRFPHDEVGLWESGNIVRSFFVGAVFSSALVYMAMTESVLVFFASLFLMFFCVVLFIDLCMIMRGKFYLSHNITFAVIGFLISLFIFVNAAIFFPLYFFVTVVILVLLWFKKYIIKKRKIRNPFSST